MRPPQHNNNNNKNRNRNRNNNNNRRNNMGGSGGQQGGTGANRVYDSNGPDVKLRGTAQTVAEKYMQLARDALSSGDTVMAESYFQFGDHYYRVWLANQPVGQPLQFSRRMAEEEFEDEGGNENADGDEDQNSNDNTNSESGEASEAVAASEEAPQEGQQADGYQNRNNNRNRDFKDNNNRDGNSNRNFRQRWPRRNERNNQDNPNGGQAIEGQTDSTERQDRFEPTQVVERVAAPEVAVAETSNWEAPSFLTRPTPVIAERAEIVDADAAPVRAPRGRRPRAPAPAETPENSPQGE